MALSFLPLQEIVYLDLDSLEQLCDRTRAVVISQASMTGEVVDLSVCSDFCRAHDLLLIVDAAPPGFP